MTIIDFDNHFKNIALNKTYVYFILNNGEICSGKVQSVHKKSQSIVITQDYTFATRIIAIADIFNMKYN
jgi:hypothetical protein